MKTYIKYLPILFLSFCGCQDLTNLEPSQTETYVKFFGDLGNNFAITVLETPEGDYLCLGNNVVLNDNNNLVTTTLLFKVDIYGNLIWVSTSLNDVEGFRAKDLALGDDGYYVLGDSIDLNSGINKMMLVKTSTSGDLGPQIIIESISAASDGKSFSSSALYAENDSEVIGLGSWDNNGTEELFYLKFNFTTGGFDWVQDQIPAYSPGKALVKDVLTSKYVWVANSTNGEAFRASANQIPGSKVPLPVLRAVDLDQGSTNNHFGGIGNDVNGNIIFYDILPDMTLQDSWFFPNDTDAEGLALSVSAIPGSGYTVLTSSNGNFTLHKTNSNGRVLGSGNSTFSKTFDWTSTETTGAAISTSDGGFLVLGTSETGSVNMLVLIKTDKDGDL